MTKKTQQPIYYPSSRFMETPDLSGFSGPFPKPNAKDRKPAKPLNKIGKKGKASLSAVEQLKVIFAEWGIVSCEWKHAGCWKKKVLTFAHSDKRRYLTEEDIKDPSHVALICTPGHMELEKMPREKMKKIIREIVRKRKI